MSWPELMIILVMVVPIVLVIWFVRELFRRLPPPR